MRNIIDHDEERVDKFALSDRQAMRYYRSQIEGRAAETISMINYDNVEKKAKPIRAKRETSTSTGFSDLVGLV